MNREVLSESATLRALPDSVNNIFLPFFEAVVLGILAGRFHFDVTSECWEWPNQRRTYGLIRVNGRYYVVHRLAYQACNGPIPDKMMVCHKCDNPPCFNPSHLFVGTHRDNCRDAASKGRTSRGERHVHAVITEATARQIKLRLSDGAAVREIVQALSTRGVSHAIVQAIRAGKTWKWLTA